MSTKNNEALSLDQAEKVIIKPYITEKTFNLIEKENKLTFVVAEKSTKKQIVDALLVLYESKATEVNTLRTVQGKKAVVKFIAAEGARDLATKLGLV
jgi:large subunit ribosomal protein L23